MTTSHIKDTFNNLAGGLKLALLLPVTSRQFTFNQLQLVSIILLALLLDVGGDWMDVAPPVEFNFYGVSYLLSLYLINIASLYFISLLYRRSANTVELLILLYASYPIVFVISYLASDPIALSDNLTLTVIIIGLILCWSLIILYRAIRLIFPGHWYLSVASLLLYSLANFSAYLFIPEQPLWYGDLSAADNAYKKSINTENTYYRQHDLMESALQYIAPGDTQVTEYYYLGFSPDGRQDVFLKESYRVRDIVERLFDTSERSVLLLNHFTTYQEQPLATGHNMQLALRHLDRKMNTDDILLLFLTAHGSKTYTLGVDFASMQLNDLSASDLAGMLNATSIRWRIIIVSACYSGGFIDALANPQTLVVTAAARDKQSSGCSDEYDATWFTDAYFSQGLTRTASFIDAFGIARDIVKQREQQAGVAFSNPQIFIGEEIRNRLGFAPANNQVDSPYAK